MVLDNIPLKRKGQVSLYPTYWRSKADFHPALAQSDRVAYLPGSEVEAAGCTVAIERVLPYFKRNDLTFSSHFQTPPVAEASVFPAVVSGDGFVYFADPIFREYRQYGNIAARDGWRQAMLNLIGPAPIGDGLPTTVLSVPRRRGDDLLVTLLHYIPTRKALESDMIEERSSFAGEVLRLPATATKVKVFSTNEELTQTTDGGWNLPPVKGRLLIEASGFFKE